jgi:hypothetical protein
MKRKAMKIRSVPRRLIHLGSEIRLTRMFQIGAEREYMPWFRIKTPPIAKALSINYKKIFSMISYTRICTLVILLFLIALQSKDI